jgi:hypothetical protein
MFKLCMHVCMCDELYLCFNFITVSVKMTLWGYPFLTSVNRIQLLPYLWPLGSNLWVGEVSEHEHNSCLTHQKTQQVSG